MEKKSFEFAPQDRIDHPVYGLGSIVEVNERHTTIDFDEAGTKKFLTSIVALTASSTPAPKKSSRRKTKAPAKGAAPAKTAKKAAKKDPVKK